MTTHPPAVLGPRALNRALLARQHLSRRIALPAAAAITHLVGMQAQSPSAPYFGLWSRLEGFVPDELSRLMLARDVVRLALMRSTLHLVTAEDCLALRPVLQAVQERNLYTASPYGKRLAGLDVAAVVAAGRALVEEAPRTTAALGRLLHERFPDGDPEAMANAVRNLAPLVQVTPRGVWGKAGQAMCTTAERWLGRPLATDPSPDRLVLRYLAAFGPASTADVQAWSGMTRLAAVMDRLRPGLLVFRDERGRELFDLPDAPRPDPDTPAPPRFLAEYDNVALGHADRTRILSEANFKRLTTPNGVGMSAFLLDGFVAGTWKLVQARGTATLHIAPLERLSPEDEAALVAEGERLLAFAAEGAGERGVRFEGCYVTG